MDDPFVLRIGASNALAGIRVLQETLPVSDALVDVETAVEDAVAVDRARPPSARPGPRQAFSVRKAWSDLSINSPSQNPLQPPNKAAHSAPSRLGAPARAQWRGVSVRSELPVPTCLPVASFGLLGGTLAVPCPSVSIRSLHKKPGPNADAKASRELELGKLTNDVG